MKKKPLILLGSLLLVVVAVKLLFFTQPKYEQVSQTWETDAVTIDQLAFKKAKQPVNVSILQTERAFTTVKVEGKLTKAQVKKLKQTDWEEQTLILNLSSGWFSRKMTNEDSLDIAITVFLGLDANVATYDFSGESAIMVQVPRDFSGQLVLDSKKGAVASLSTFTESDQTLLKVTTAGDIEIVN